MSEPTRIVVDGFSAIVDQHVVGDGLDPEVTMGPLNNKAQLDVLPFKNEDEAVRMANDSDPQYSQYP